MLPRGPDGHAVADQIATDPDYVVLTGRVPAAKGKWRIVSEDVEAAGNEL
jgi:hypothetical protein